jgi:hypothetical protein
MTRALSSERTKMVTSWSSLLGGAPWNQAATAAVVLDDGGHYSNLHGQPRIDARSAVFTNGHLHCHVLSALHGQRGSRRAAIEPLDCIDAADVRDSTFAGSARTADLSTTRHEPAGRVLPTALREMVSPEPASRIRQNKTPPGQSYNTSPTLVMNAQ